MNAYYDYTVVWLRIVNRKLSRKSTGGFMNHSNQQNSLRLKYQQKSWLFGCGSWIFVMYYGVGQAEGTG
jgi:hypothetical protein